MAEVPSNVLLVDRFAERFDGFSIGSNDLTQLVLGIDRDSTMLADMFDERDEAVLQARGPRVPRPPASAVAPVGARSRSQGDHARILRRRRDITIGARRDLRPGAVGLPRTTEFAEFLVAEGIDAFERDREPDHLDLPQRPDSDGPLLGPTAAERSRPEAEARPGTMRAGALNGAGPAGWRNGAGGVQDRAPAWRARRRSAGAPPPGCWGGPVSAHPDRRDHGAGAVIAATRVAAASAAVTLDGADHRGRVVGEPVLDVAHLGLR
jgi:hypothetical protein